MRHKTLFIILFLTISSLGDAQNTWRKVEYPGGSRFDPIQPLSNGAIIRPWYGQRGLFRSMDNGQTWSLLIGPYSILYEPLTSGTRDVRYGSKDSIIVADGTDKDGQAHAFLSRDLGETWTEITSPPGGISTAPMTVHKSQIFTFSFFPYRYNEEYNRWDTVFHRPSLLYAQEDAIWAYGTDTLYKSIDAGQNWTSVMPLLARRLVMRGDTIVTTDPCRRTFNGGTNWEEWTPPELINEIFDDGQSMYLTSDYRTYRSNDFFETMDTLFDNNILNLFRVNEQDILASGRYGCYKSSDNGQTWIRSNTGIGPSDHGYDVLKTGNYIHATHILFSSAGNEFIQVFSDDYGTTWKGCVNVPYVANSLKINNDYFGVISNQLYRSKNAIIQWQHIPFAGTEDYSVLKLAARNDTLLVFATRQGLPISTMWRINTHIEPLAFTQVSTPLPTTPKSYVMHNNVLFISDDFNVWKSSNLGQSWQTVTSPGIGGGLYSNGARLYFVGQNGILFSLNSGNTWQQVPFPVNMFGAIRSFTPSPTAIYMTDYSERIYYQNIGSSTWDTLAGLPLGQGLGRVETLGPYLFIPDSFSEIWTNAPETISTYENEDEEKILVFPNPVGSLLNIRFPEVKQGDHSVHIFSQTGELMFEQKNTGNSLSLSVKHWPSNVYFLLWKNGQQVFVKKIIKI